MSPYNLITNKNIFKKIRKIISITILVAFISTSVKSPVYAQDFSVNQLPVPGTMIGESAPFVPLALKGLIVNPQKPLEFQFIVDTGKGPQDTASIKEEANQLVKYFLAGLTIPEGDLWVNLSPYEKNRMVPEVLGQTDLGRDLLAQDYILKQLTASLIYPEKDLGKEFWSKVYAKAQQQYGTTNIPVNTFNKVWILPNEAQVYENINAAYVTKSTLKVMLDEDYTALQKHMPVHNSTDSIGSQIVREIVLPEIEKEVNTGKNFAPLRQIYQALILAKWYKETIQNGLLDAVYTDKNKVAGVNLNDPSVKEQIYERYLRAYKKGAFNYIKEDPTPSGQVVPRKYFSGGTRMAIRVEKIHSNRAMLVKGWVAGTLLAVTLALFSVGNIASGQSFFPSQISSNNIQLKTSDLINVLNKTSNSNNDSQRAEAARALGEIGDIRAIPVLEKALKGNLQSEETKANAAVALGKIGDSNDVKPLIDFLKSAEALFVQESAEEGLRTLAKRLGNSGKKEYIMPLVEALEASNYIGGAGGGSDFRYYDDTIEEALVKLGAPKEVIINAYTKAFTEQDEGHYAMDRLIVLGASKQQIINGYFFELSSGNDREGYAEKKLRELGASKDEIVKANLTVIASAKDGGLHDNGGFTLSFKGLATLQAVENLADLGDARAIEPLRILLEDDRFKEPVQETMRKLGASTWDLESDSDRSKIRILGVVGVSIVGLAGLLVAWKTVTKRKELAVLQTHYVPSKLIGQLEQKEHELQSAEEDRQVDEANEGISQPPSHDGTYFGEKVGNYIWKEIGEYKEKYEAQWNLTLGEEWVGTGRGYWERESDLAMLQYPNKDAEKGRNAWVQAETIEEKRDLQGHLLAPNGKLSHLSEKLWKLVRTETFKKWFGDWENSPEEASKIVDENGEPLVMRHTSANDFTVFKQDKIASRNHRLNGGKPRLQGGLGSGMYFAVKPEVLDNFSDGKKSVIYEVFLNLRNPKIIDQSDFRTHPIFGSLRTEFLDIRANYNKASEQEQEMMDQRMNEINRILKEAADKQTADALKDGFDGSLDRPEYRVVNGKSILRPSNKTYAIVVYLPEAGAIKSIYNVGTFNTSNSDIIENNSENHNPSEALKLRNDLKSKSFLKDRVLIGEDTAMLIPFTKPWREERARKVIDRQRQAAELERETKLRDEQREQKDRELAARAVAGDPAVRLMTYRISETAGRSIYTGDMHIMDTIVSAVYEDGVVIHLGTRDNYGYDDVIQPPSRYTDKALLTQESAPAVNNQSVKNGGIDLNKINVLRNGKKVNVQFDPAQLNALKQGGFKGFTPVIINMTRISSPLQLLGISSFKQDIQLAKA